MMTTEKTRKQKVLDLLADGQWHKTAEICRWEVGGSEGTRRLRELRNDGVAIEKRKAKGSTQYEYRLSGEKPTGGATPSLLGGNWFEECFCSWSNYGFGGAVVYSDPECPSLPHPRVYRQT